MVEHDPEVLAERRSARPRNVVKGPLEHADLDDKMNLEVCELKPL